jgi:hypothetical protein
MDSDDTGFNNSHSGPVKMASRFVFQVLVRHVQPRRFDMPRILRPTLSLVVLTLAVGALAVEGQNAQQFALVPTVAFTSTRDYPSGVGSGTPQERLFASAEIYLIATPDLVFDPSQPLRRVTHNEVGDNAAVLSPLGKQLVFESIRLRGAGEPLQLWDLFLLNLDDHSDASFVVPDNRHVHLTRGASAAWERNGKRIAFQASTARWIGGRIGRRAALFAPAAGHFDPYSDWPAGGPISNLNVFAVDARDGALLTRTSGCRRRPPRVRDTRKSGL